MLVRRDGIHTALLNCNITLIAVCSCICYIVCRMAGDLDSYLYSCIQHSEWIGEVIFA